MNKRPISVTIIAVVYIVAGAAGLIYHAGEILTSPWVGVVRALAIVAGVFMLRAQNWARWLAMVWIAFHVVLSAFHSVSEFAMHAVLCAVFAFVLFRRSTNRYFVRAR